MKPTGEAFDAISLDPESGIPLVRVFDLQASCLPMLARQFTLLEERGITMLLCRAEAIGALEAGDTQLRWFPSLDLALEDGDTLLDRLHARHREVIAPLLQTRDFAAGDTVMRLGETSEALFIARDPWRTGGESGPHQPAAEPAGTPRTPAEPSRRMGR